MSSDRPIYGKRLVAAAALATFVLLAVGVGCRGFFVNQPNSVSVTTGLNGSGSSTFTITTQGGTQQLFATATFNSGNKDVTNSATWQSSSSCATVNTKGIVTAVGNASSVTITATLDAVDKTTTLTVETPITSVTVSPTSVTGGDSSTVTGTVTLPVAPAVDVVVTLTSSDTSAATVPATVTVLAEIGRAHV